MASQTKGSSKKGSKRLDLIKEAAMQLATLTGQRPEKVLGLEEADDGLKVSFEMLELSRMPKSTDLLGCYVVQIDKDGDLVSYERSHRYQRGQADGAHG